jgi:hypothetical protein
MTYSSEMPFQRSRNLKSEKRVTSNGVQGLQKKKKID